jgi:N-glycosidase YbiA
MIRFYDQKEDYFQFSNFYPLKQTPIVYNNKSYPTTEHAYQSAKFNDVVYSEIIRRANTPNIARILASQQIGGGYTWRTALNPIIEKYSDVKIRTDWEEVKESVMEELLWLKFNIEEFKQLLLSTEDKILIEDGNGENKLGKLLMKTRDRLRKKTVIESPVYSLINNMVKEL